MKSVTQDFFNEFMNELKTLKIKYKFIITGSTICVRSKLGDYFYTRSGIPYNQLHFIQRVKKHVLSKKFNFKRYTKKDATYYSYGKLRSGIIKNVYEVDINQAYWEAALKLQVIDKRLYNSGLKFNKITRLASLGSLAKNPTVIRFDGDKECFEKDKPANTNYIWFNICKEISDQMLGSKKLLKKNFICFWVDGVYFKGKRNIPIIQKFFLQHDYSSKVRALQKIEVNLKEKRLYMYDKGSNNKQDSRYFPIV